MSKLADQRRTRLASQDEPLPSEAISLATQASLLASEEFFPPLEEKLPHLARRALRKEAVFLPTEAVFPPVEAVFPPVQAVFPPVQAVFPPVQAKFPPMEAVFPPMEAVCLPLPARVLSQLPAFEAGKRSNSHGVERRGVPASHQSQPAGLPGGIVESLARRTGMQPRRHGPGRVRDALVLVALATACAVTPVTPAPAGAADPAEIRKVLQTIVDARWALTDTGTARRREVAETVLADEFVHIFENGDVSTKEDMVRGRTAESTEAAAKARRENDMVATVERVDTVFWRDTAVATYFLDTRITLNGERVTKLFKCSETLVWRDRRWQSVLHTETVVPGDPQPAAVNVDLYNDYVGKYRLTPSVTYTVAREGTRLLWGSRKQELVPENDNTFVFRRQADRKRDLNTSYRVVFVRNDKGVVTHLRLREFPGVEYSALKIE